MVHLRVARSGEREEIPVHFEGMPMTAKVRAVGWPVALAAAICGVTVMVLQPGLVVEVGAALVAAFGAMTIGALVRCRRFEVVIGERWLRTICGPLRHHVPLQLIAGASIRPASSWRRLFAEREVVLEVPVGIGEDPVPSREPEELIDVLREVMGAS